MMKCDPVTGACLLPDLDPPVDAAASAAPNARHGWAVRYIGDPMCSWCWGISPTVGAVETFCKAEGIEFSITMGGLRAGGGDPWNAAFKGFLRNEWRHIAQATGQPFGFTLLEAAHFDYDTEPACRAVATAKLLQARKHLPSSTALAFFSAVQRKFYVEGQDPKAVDFYANICTSLALDFDEFRAVFESPEALRAVQQEFTRCRQWGVRSFPTLLLERDGATAPLAEGFVTAEQVLARLRQAIAA
ncbi:MAG: DsbA family protein [Simplicispira suum]|uniref:DsbA family protein n=1 Tax=Simplicispira suum TaxID=2109915 RepID=UPI001C6AFD0D|nr:DsbA family protein [Simplicispira suum]MBW7834602.1 DsbA family protein [Simplicispira suum]